MFLTLPFVFVMDSFMEGAALGGIELCQNLISANVEQKSVDEQFRQSEAQSQTKSNTTKQNELNSWKFGAKPCGNARHKSG